MAFGSTTFNGLDERQAYDTLRELVLKIERGEVRVLEMSLTQEAPETRSFRTMDGRMMDRQMVVSAGELSVTVRVALCDPLRAEPMESRDEKGRLRGVTGTPRDMRTNPWREASWNLTAQADFLKNFGPEKAAEMMRAADVAPFGPRDTNGVLSRAEMLRASGMTLDQFERVRSEIANESATFEGVEFPRPKTNTQAPVDPMNYGARKVDID